MTELEQETLLHESGHACAALVQGLPVLEVSRVSSDPSRYLGYTSFPLAALTDAEQARKSAVMLLAGPGLAEQPLPSWPLSDNKTNDEKLLKIFSEHLGLDQKGYEDLVEEMWDLSVTRKFTRLFTAITCWLERTPRLDRYMLLNAMAIAWL